MTPTKFKLSEAEWATSLALATASQKERDRFWATLGAVHGFDPTTVDLIRPLVFKAEPVAPSEAGRATAEEADVTRAERTPSGRSGRTSAAPASLDADELPHVDVKVERRAESPQELPAGRPLPGAVPPRRKPARGTRAPRTDAVIATANDGDLVQVDQVPCGRCGQKHHGVTFSKLDRPVILGPETLTHYSWCPMTGQPMLLSIDAPGQVRIPADVERMKTDSAVDLGADEAAEKPRTRVRSKAKAGR